MLPWLQVLLATLHWKLETNGQQQWWRCQDACAKSKQQLLSGGRGGSTQARLPRLHTGCEAAPTQMRARLPLRAPQNNMTCVERIVEYLNLPQEPPRCACAAKAEQQCAPPPTAHQQRA